MSFIQDLAKKKKGEEILKAQAEPQAINMPGAVAGLASTANIYRDPYRVNGPINSVTTPSNRSRMLQS
jgi:hypothetical protein